MKTSHKFMLGIVMMIMIVVTMQSALADVPNGGVRYYNFSSLVDLWSGFDAVNSGADSSSEYPSFATSGNSSPTSFYFNSNNDDHVQTGQFEIDSISMWFKPSVEVTTSSGSVGLMGTAGVVNYGIRLGPVTSNINNEIITIVDAGNSDVFYWDSSDISSISTNWHHIVLIWDSVNSNYRLYYDGVDKGLASTYGSPARDEIVWDLGDYYTNEFDGWIDEFKQFNRTLNSTEIYNLYNYGNITGPSTPTENMTISITSTYPSNNTQFNTESINISAIVNSSGTFNCSLYINDVLNQSNNSITNGTAVNVSFEVPFANDTESTYTYYINCSGGDNSTVSTTNTFYIDNVLPNIYWYAPTFTKYVIDTDNPIFTTNISVEDTNLYAYYYNISYLNGTNIYSYSNTTLTGETNYTINTSIDMTGYVGVFNVTLKVCDGHTAKEIKTINNIKKYNDKVEFLDNKENVKIEIKDNFNGKSTDVVKYEDRYKFSFKTKNKRNQETFKVTSDDYIDILHGQTEYQGHLITGHRWIDFEKEGVVVTNIKRISDNEVEVTAYSKIAIDDWTFNSIGELNCDTESTLFLITNTTAETNTLNLRGDLVTFTLNISNYNNTFYDNFTATFTLQNVTYTTTGQNYSTYYLFTRTLELLNEIRPFEEIGTTISSGGFTNPEYAFDTSLTNYAYKDSGSDYYIGKTFTEKYIKDVDWKIYMESVGMTAYLQKYNGTDWINVTSTTDIGIQSYTTTVDDSVSGIRVYVVPPGIRWTRFYDIAENEINVDWNYTLNGNSYDTEEGIEVHTPAIDDCSSYTTEWIRFFMIDEETNLAVNGTNTYGIDIWNGNYVGTRIADFVVNQSEYPFCMYPSWGNFSGNISMTYKESATSFTSRSYSSNNYVIDNSSENVTLLILGFPTEVQVNIIDGSENVLENILIKCYKYNVDTDDETLVTQEYTDSNGNVVFGLAVGTTNYRFEIWQDDVLKINTTNFKLFSQYYQYVIKEVETIVINDWFNTKDYIVTSITFNSPLTYNWSINTTNIDYISLKLWTTNSTLFDFTTTNNSGSYVYNLIPDDRNQSYYAKITAHTVNGNSFIIDQLTIPKSEKWDSVLGIDKIAIALIILLLFALFGVFNSFAMVILTDVAIIGLTLIGFLPFSIVEVMSFIVLSIIVLWILLRRER